MKKYTFFLLTAILFIGCAETRPGVNESDYLSQTIWVGQKNHVIETETDTINSTYYLDFKTIDKGELIIAYPEISKTEDRKPFTYTYSKRNLNLTMGGEQYTGTINDLNFLTIGELDTFLEIAY